MPSADKIYSPKKPRSKDVSYIEADILTNLRLAAEFSRLAEAHASLFDDNGFRYCCDRFIDHGRLVANHLKKLREES